MWSLWSGSSIGPLVFSSTTLPARSDSGSIHWTAWGLTWNWGSGFRRLGLIGAQQSIFEGCAVETADDEVHLFRVRGVDESESFGFLSLRIADYLHVVVDEVFWRSART